MYSKVVPKAAPSISPSAHLMARLNAALMSLIARDNNISKLQQFVGIFRIWRHFFRHPHTYTYIPVIYVPDIYVYLSPICNTRYRIAYITHPINRYTAIIRIERLQWVMLNKFACKYLVKLYALVII